MKKVITLFLTIVLCLSAALPSVSQSQRQPAQKNKFRKVKRAVPNNYIVVLNDQNTGDTASIASEVAITNGGKIKYTYDHAIKGFSIELPEQAAIALSHDPRVEYVEEDGEISANGFQYYPPWGLDRIDQKNLPLDFYYRYDATGASVNVYVLDSGILTSHSEFGGRASVAYDAFGGNGIDCYGHGTHVAGIIGSSMHGVAKGVNLFSVRVLNCSGSGDTSTVIAGVNWVTAHHRNMAVANMSLGGGFSSSLNQAVRNSIASGVTYVVAAGNGTNNDGIAVDAKTQSPASVTEAITVGSTDRNDVKASSSNFGDVVDIFAPGVSITSTWIGSNTATRVNSGTSMASPHVAGVAALYLQGYPSAKPADVRRAITYNATFSKVRNSGPGTPNRLLFSYFAPGVLYPEPNDVPLYRFHTNNPLRHFYTTNYNEGVNAGFIIDGVQSYVFARRVTGSVALYRFQANYPLRHFYTTNYNEGVNAGFTYNGVQCYVYPNQVGGTVPLYRFRASSAPLRHFYTTIYNEGSNAGYIYEGIQGYVYRWW